jgi:hypothetical protein
MASWSSDDSIEIDGVEWEVGSLLPRIDGLFAIIKRIDGNVTTLREIELNGTEDWILQELPKLHRDA